MALLGVQSCDLGLLIHLPLVVFIILRPLLLSAIVLLTFRKPLIILLRLFVIFIPLRPPNRLRLMVPTVLLRTPSLPKLHATQTAPVCPESIGPQFLVETLWQLQLHSVLHLPQLFNIPPADFPITQRRIMQLFRPRLLTRLF
jgi:hypothetical protein